MGNVAIQVRFQKQEIDQEELIKTISRMLGSVETMFDHNTTFYADPAAPYLFSAELTKYNTCEVSRIAAGSPFYVGRDFYNDTGVLRELVSQTKKVLAGIKLGEVVNGLKFPYEITGAPTSSSIALGHVIDSTVCPLCRGLYTKIGLNSHMGSLRCMRDKQCLDVKDMNYEILDDSAAIAAIRKAGLEFKVRPTALDMWVPQWVIKAVKDYRTNKGFAGMKLHEFLKVIKGNE